MKKRFVRLTLPKRPFKNFEEYIQKSATRLGKALICLECDGSGRVHLWEDRDPIEGWKMAPSYTCSSCRGSGLWNRIRHREVYDQKIADWKARRDKEALRARKETEIIERLSTWSDEEISLLNELLNRRRG